jgi:glycosyltransferase involved in cell wall biosynthesis
MKIAIDALPLMMPKTGIGFYTHHLLSEFIKIAPENEYYLCDMLWGQSFCHLIKVEKDLRDILQSLQNVSRIPFPFQPIIRIALSLSTKLVQDPKKMVEMDLFFGPNFRGFFTEKLKTVITIHDMSYEYFPDSIGKKLLAHLKKELPRTTKQASLMVADSQNTKMDIMEFLEVPGEKVRVIYPGVDETFQPVKDSGMMKRVRKTYGLPEKFILYVGAIQPRKNIIGLIQAYSILSKEPDFGHDLVIAGGVDWKNDEIHRLVNELGLRDKIRFPGYITSSDLPTVYNLAEAFVFPSFYEGFGLPVLEAMACGIPVVTSNVSSVPEVAGDAAVLINPFDSPV